MVDVLAQEETQLDLRNQLEGEVAFVVVKGSIEIDGETVEAGQMCISTTDSACSIHLQKDARVLLFGGEPLDDEPLLSWNFVSSDREKLKQARLDWEARKFPKVPGDETYIPFP
jgi:redox-sensitive bicupin YhaK (pirin superfamily)